MNNKICGIYKITSPTGKTYIGQSVDVNKRWSRYKNLSCKKQTRLYNSLKKYGFDAHQFDIIEYCTEEELNCSERFWQDEFDVLGNKGLNGVLQECGAKHHVKSEEYKKRISDTLKGRKLPSEVIARMSASKKGVLKSEETKKRMSVAQKGENNPMYGKTFTAEHLKRMSQAMLGKTMSEEAKDKMRPSKIGINNVTSRLVLDTLTGIFYYCIREAAEAYNINYGSLRNMLNPNSNNINNTSLILV